MSKLSETSESKEFFGLEIFRERGSIVMVRLDKAADSSVSADAAIKHIKPVDALKRAAAVVVYHQRDETPPSERNKARRLMEFMEKIVKDAIAFGDPTDPKVLDHIIRHDSKTSIVMPRSMNTPHKIKCKDSATETLLNGYELTPDFGKIAGIN